MAAIYAKALLRKDYSGVSEHDGDGKVENSLKELQLLMLER